MSSGTLGTRRLAAADGLVVVYTAPDAGPTVDHIMVDLNVVNLSGGFATAEAPLLLNILVNGVYIEYNTLIEVKQGIFRTIGLISPGDTVSAELVSGNLADIRLSGIVVPPLVY